MERFAFKIDKVLKANLYKICRLCGIDNPDKVPILTPNNEEVVDLDSEPELWQKIKDCVGFLITKDDKMPQMICSLCVDKINDFYEFREMCYATNTQTRKLLGLKDVPKKNVEIKVEVKTEPASYIDRRGNKRKSEDVIADTVNNKQKIDLNINTISKKRARIGFPKNNKNATNAFTELDDFKTEIKTEMPVEAVLTVPEDKKLKEACDICSERFKSKCKVNRHKALIHLPHIPRYVCTTCDVTIKKNGEIRSHQLWHKLTRTPYTCALCGECTSSINLYTRHLREHAQKLSTELVVPDHLCVQCNQTFCTNFLYNIHTCSVRTRKCGGCNRHQKNELEFQRHAALCDKAYLTISKHLAPVLEPVRIKNENDVEAQAKQKSSNNISTMMSTGAGVGVPSSMDTSVVINASEVDGSGGGGASGGDNILQMNKSSKKANKKGISKKDLKRVDDLLKYTMDTLVSIKHEPEMHVDSDAPTNNVEQHSGEQDAAEAETPTFDHDDDDFQNRDDFSDDGDGGGGGGGDNGVLDPIVQLETENNGVVVKQEPLDNIDEETRNNMETSPNIVAIKRELPDSGYEDSSAAGSIAKVPVLKLKINKLLNDNLMNRDKKKKKKKRKDTADKFNDQLENNETSSASASPTKSSSTMPLPGIIQIKQERIDDDDDYGVGAVNYTEMNESQENAAAAASFASTPEFSPPPAETTVMTSIPMAQFQIACVSSGVEFNEPPIVEREQQQHDVKPNRAELDRIWQEINNSSKQQANENSSGGTEVTNISKPRQNSSSIYKKMPSRSKALKSTSGIARRTNTAAAAAATAHKMPMIVAVSSGFDAIAAQNDGNVNSSQFLALPNVVVKAEPRDDGYELGGGNAAGGIGESTNKDSDSDQEMPSLQNNVVIADDNEEEQSYINSIDFNNICIKQEKDIEITESQLTDQHIPHNLYNGSEEDVLHEDSSKGNLLVATRNRIDSDAEDDEDDEDDDDEDEEMEIDEDDDDNLEKEYRELEWPPPLIEPKIEAPEPLTLVIASVCSQADQANNYQEPNKSNELSLSPLKDIKSNAEDGDKREVYNSASISNADEPVTSMSFKIVEHSENLLKTSEMSEPPVHNTVVETNLTIENIDEEQQNILNHEVVANSELQQSSEDFIPPTSVLASASEEPEPEPEPEMEMVKSSATLSNCNEETDNYLNENVDAADHRRNSENESASIINTQNPQNPSQQQQRPLLLDDSNINEIAENNNNANIERELLDDNSNSDERINESPLIVETENHNNEIT